MLTATDVDKPGYSDIDVSDAQFWNISSEEREQTFARLRREQPISWQRPVDDAVSPDPNDPGYWALVKHEDIVRVSQDHDTFISGQGVLFDLLPPAFLEMSQSFLAMDNPKHDMLRRLVSSAFTPKQIGLIEDRIIGAARRVVDGFATEPSGEVEFVSSCTQKLPMQMFGDVMGIPESLRYAAAKGAQDVVSWSDPEQLAGRPAAETQVAACQALHQVAEELIEQKRRKPANDLMTNLVQAEVDGRRLDDLEIRSFFALMAVAGTDTTKHTASFTARAMTQFPEQRDWLRADYNGRIKPAIEEFLRYASPVMTFRRTVVKETEIRGARLIPGDKVVMFYPSANRDETVFDRPFDFDLSRSPNPHLGFGGGGVHYCMGNQLAKSMLRALFAELLTRVPDFEADEPELLTSNFMRGIKRMTVRFTPEKG